MSSQDTPMHTKYLPRETVPKLKIPEQLRQDLLLQKPQDSSVQRAPVPNKTPERQRLKRPELLEQELLQVSARSSSKKGAPMHNKTPERQRLKIPEPLMKEMLQVSP